MPRYPEWEEELWRVPEAGGSQAFLKSYSFSMMLEFVHMGKEARREGQRCREELRNHRCQSTEQEVIATN